MTDSTMPIKAYLIQDISSNGELEHERIGLIPLLNRPNRKVTEGYFYTSESLEAFARECFDAGRHMRANKEAVKSNDLPQIVKTLYFKYGTPDDYVVKLKKEGKL